MDSFKETTICSVEIFCDKDEEMKETISFYEKELGFFVLKKEKETVILSSSLFEEETNHPTIKITLDKDKKKGGFDLLFYQKTDKEDNLLVDPVGNRIKITKKRDLCVCVPKKVFQEKNIEEKHIFETKEAIGFMTSGGDSPGMNAAIRAIVRNSIKNNLTPYAIYNGYQGLIEGENKIKKFGWYDVEGILNQGGTIIRSSRSEEFKTKEGKLKAARNMISKRIKNLIIIGGDGSLTGANRFKEEWPSLIKELRKNEEIDENQERWFDKIRIVGLCGSIDNDMAGTTMTIGADSSLHRVVEAIDSISITAESHKRAFVVQVMGRDCGWIAMMAHVALGADWVFLPEDPPHAGKWEEEMCNVLRWHREKGKNSNIVIVSEGAIDSDLNPISVDYIKKIIVDRLGYDTRASVLGHLQRGGTPSAYDRYLATTQGVDAVEAIIEQIKQKTDEPVICCIGETRIIRKPLMECVNSTKNIQKAIREKKFQNAIRLRDIQFQTLYRMIKEIKFSLQIPKKKENVYIGLLNIGSPSSGMNAATKTIVQYAHSRGYGVLGIRNGFEGFNKGDVKELSFAEVENWLSVGGSELISNKRMIDDNNSGNIAYQIQRHRIAALIIVGGMEGIRSVYTMTKKRNQYPAFCIPLVCLPASNSNDVAGTNVTIGSDTALNIIQSSCDSLRKSAASSHRRIFIVEVHGNTCGYLSAQGGLISGATFSYIPEIGIKLDDLKECVNAFKEEFQSYEEQGKILIITESKELQRVYNSEIISKILHEESDGLFDSRVCKLGHIQQGMAPSPMDRIRACRLGVIGLNYIFQFLDSVSDTTSLQSYFQQKEKDSSVLIGIKGVETLIRPIEEIIEKYNKKNTNIHWWDYIRPISKLLSKKPKLEDKV